MNKLHLVALAALVSVPAIFAGKNKNINDKGIIDTTLDYMARPAQVLWSTSLRDIYTPVVTFKLRDIPGAKALFAAPKLNEKGEIVADGGLLYTKFNAPLTTVLLAVGAYKLSQKPVRTKIANAVKYAKYKVCNCR